jgi:hypothetical protein
MALLIITAVFTALHYSVFSMEFEVRRRADERFVTDPLDFRRDSNRRCMELYKEEVHSAKLLPHDNRLNKNEMGKTWAVMGT